MRINYTHMIIRGQCRHKFKKVVVRFNSFILGGGTYHFALH